MAPTTLGINMMSPGEVFRALSVKGLNTIKCCVCEFHFSVNDLHYWWYTDSNAFSKDIIPGVKLCCGAECCSKVYNDPQVSKTSKIQSKKSTK